VPIAVIPLKAFHQGKERLSPALGAGDREHLARNTATRVLAACVAAGLDPLVVTGDEAVAHLAQDSGAATLPDPGLGLDEAASAGVATAGPGRWCLVHGDLPLVTPADMLLVTSSLTEGRPVLAPARDGGTNVIAGTGPFRFSHGPASFHRHLAAAGPTTRIVIRAGLTVEIDTPGDLVAAAQAEGGSWLEPYLR